MGSALWLGWMRALTLQGLKMGASAHKQASRHTMDCAGGSHVNSCYCACKTLPATCNMHVHLLCCRQAAYVCL
jgi:hypothetical protein